MNIKKLLTIGCLAVSLSTGARAGSLDSPFSVILGFRATGDNLVNANTSVWVGLNDFTWNSLAAQSFAFGSVLSTQFGNDWYSNGNIRWGLYGVSQNAGPDGDGMIDGNPGYGVVRVGTESPVTLADGSFASVSPAGIQLETLQINLAAAGTSTTGGYTYGILGAVDTSIALSVAPAFRSMLNEANNIFSTEFDLSTTSSLAINQFLPNGDFTAFGEYSQLGTVSIANDGQISVTAIPEPSTYALMGLGALLVIIVARRAKQA